MLFKVFSRNEAESAIYTHTSEACTNHIVISITSSTTPVVLHENKYRVGVEYFHFDDVGHRPKHKTEEEWGKICLRVHVFTEDDAKRILDFVEDKIDNINSIIVHCDAGISRSAATAACLSKILTLSDDEFFKGRYCPNMYVYNKLLNYYYENIEDYPKIDNYYKYDLEDILY